MSDQDEINAMLHSIGQVFGPAVKYIQFDDGSSFALPDWEARTEPLSGYGDTVSVGDWAWITHHWKDGGKVSQRTEPFPQQIIYISPETPPSIAYAVRDGGCPFFNARLRQRSLAHLSQGAPGEGPTLLARAPSFASWGNTLDIAPTDKARAAGEVSQSERGHLLYSSSQLASTARPRRAS